MTISVAGKRFAFDILRQHQQRAAGFYDLIEQRQEILEHALETDKLDFPIGLDLLAGIASPCALPASHRPPLLGDATASGAERYG